MQRLSEAHYVDSSELGIPRAEQDTDGELLLGVCKRCQATRLLSSLGEHEASCKPEQECARQPSPAPAPAPLSAASEGHASLSQVLFTALPAIELCFVTWVWCHTMRVSSYISTLRQPLQRVLSGDAFCL